MFVNGCHGRQIQPARQFFITRAETVFFDEPGYVVEDFFLSLRERHAPIMGERKENFKRKLYDQFRPQRSGVRHIPPPQRGPSLDCLPPLLACAAKVESSVFK